MTLRVAVAGASGYAGGELVRLLAGHPELDVVTVTAHSNAGMSLGSLHPHLSSLGLTLEETSAKTLDGHDVVFLALPHGTSGGLGDVVEANLVVDCGADHRLTSADDWAQFYGGDFVQPWVYGMPELGNQRELLRDTNRIAVPGCNATAVTLGFAPLVQQGAIDADDLVSVLAVGVSGAGRRASEELLASEILGNASAYGVGGLHRHNPEILQNLRLVSNGLQNVALSFTPILVPMSRGILATNTATLRHGVKFTDIRSAIAETYAHHQFITVLPEGQQPRTANVLGSNAVHIQVAMDERARRAVVTVAIDNLGKGTAGAAIQSANIALGFEEAVGLAAIGVAP